MARELKFRAWNKEDKCWYNPIMIEMNLLGHVIITHGLDLVEHIEDIDQYTGLTDKNGQEIYEEDIVKIDGLYYVVAYDDVELAYVAIDPIEGDYIPLSEAYKIDEHGNEIKAEIVGNTHEIDAKLIYESLPATQEVL